MIRISQAALILWLKFLNMSTYGTVKVISIVLDAESHVNVRKITKN